MLIPQYLLSAPLILPVSVLKIWLRLGVFEKIKIASPKAIPYVFTHKLFRRAKKFKVSLKARFMKLLCRCETLSALLVNVAQDNSLKV